MQVINGMTVYTLSELCKQHQKSHSTARVYFMQQKHTLTEGVDYVIDPTRNMQYTAKLFTLEGFKKLFPRFDNPSTAPQQSIRRRQPITPVYQFNYSVC